jgi:hypothetical protein
LSCKPRHNHRRKNQQGIPTGLGRASALPNTEKAGAKITNTAKTNSKVLAIFAASLLGFGVLRRALETAKHNCCRKKFDRAIATEG